MKKLYPPFGYKWDSEDGLDIENEKELREAAMGLSNDPKFKETIAESTKKELLEFFEENGFEIVEE